ncbi:hypothetical protein CFP65_4127 [Kitasatospora sp. MMS16-BH015]|uniref:DUF6059 family protein n=1 Tax=Kitasatospora sp. MMS16-BH015 TaxID=2018025 RepID=UPI000CA19C6F|nr:DUF6059 family protein [Kitasatospora sp. MMS16-BH015]AUG78882.1 hypothetical protein CFP65_4127 [Kitasatospora sp. MMS16-BH015]
MGTSIVRSLVRLLDSPVMLGLMACGTFFGLMVPVGAVDQPVLSGPTPGHPERLCPMEPLSPLERRLQRELR